MTKEEVAELACEIEIKDLGEPIGKQDQYACACGGLNFIEFYKDGVVDVEKLFIASEKYHQLENNLLMFYTGETRAAGDILAEQKKNTTDDKAKIENLHKMVGLAKDLKVELFNLRFQLATGQLDNPMRISGVKKDIARIKTIVRERELNIGKEA